MRTSTRFGALLMGAFLVLVSVPALAGSVSGRLAQVEVYDRTARQVLPAYRHGGAYYVAGQPGHEYELRLRSRDGGRLLAVTSIDGVNVITGQSASAQQSGYVLNRNARVEVTGWRKSMDRTAAFYFTSLPDSYAARTGRPHDVGVIGVALFREAAQPRRSREPEIAAAPRSGGDQARSAPAAPQAKVYGDSTWGEQLGTGHGRSQWSSASYTEFRRASSRPDEVITIYYDSMANLVAQGIAPAPALPSPHRPRPFPVGFVPDP